MYHLKQIPSKAQIRKYIRHIVFGKNIYCPICKTRKVTVSQDRYYCRRCRRRFSLFSHTWLSNIKISLPKFWLLLWCWTQSVPVKQTQSLSNLSEKAVRHWYEQFRNHLPKDQGTLEHIVQLDEAYFGGWTGFTLLLGKQAGTRKLAYKILPHSQPARSDAYDFLRAYIKPQSRLNTDGAPFYQGIDRWWPVEHTNESHKEFEFAKTSEIEGMFGVLRTFIRRMYHHVTPEKFPEIMGEFYCRFSHPEMFKSPYYYLLNTLSLVPTG